MRRGRRVDSRWRSSLDVGKGWQRPVRHGDDPVGLPKTGTGAYALFAADLGIQLAAYAAALGLAFRGAAGEALFALLVRLAERAARKT